MSDEFLQELMKHMTKAIDNPGDSSSTEVFTVRVTEEQLERIKLEWKTVPIIPIPVELPPEA